MLSNFLDTNVLYVLLGTTILCISTSVVGTFAFLRQRSLIGDSLSHAILPGICIAFLITKTKNPLWLMCGAFVTGWLSLLLIDIITSRTKIKLDGAIALTLSIFFAVGILLLTTIQHGQYGNQSGLNTYLFGNAASMTLFDVKVFSITAILIIATTIILFKQFRITAFNPEFGKAIGMPINSLEFLLSTLSVIAVSTGIQAVGVVLMAALLITPTAGAKYWTNKLDRMILIGMLLGGSAGLGGTYISYLAPSMPTGPWIVVILSALTLLSIAFAPKKGVIAKLKRNRKQRRKIEEENILKWFYRRSEQKADWNQTATKDQLANSLGLSKKQVSGNLKHLIRKGLLTNIIGQLSLTSNGWELSRKIVRHHRLWEMFLAKRLDLPADHVHDDAERIEHFLTPEIERILEQDLEFPELDPHNSQIPGR